MIFRFDQFEIDTARFELGERGVNPALEPQVLTLLVFLVEHRERLVSRDEIFEKLWDGRIVTDSTLASRIKSLRQALGDDGKAQRFIKTIHGKGFRFVADVQVAQDPVLVPSADAADQAAVDSEPSQRPSIAVLPFRNLAGTSPYDTLAEGLAHELITELARLRWLFIIARGSSFRFRGPDLDVREVGRVLGVRYCLSGDVEVTGKRLAIMTELADTRTGEIVWSERYAGCVDDIHAVRAEIRSRVLTSLEIQIPLHEAAGARLISSDNLDAWSAYHLGLQHMYRYNRKDNAAAAELFGRAIDQDASFARARRSVVRAFSNGVYASDGLHRQRGCPGPQLRTTRPGDRPTGSVR